MHELKTGLYADQFCSFLDISGKFLSLIRSANDPYTLYNRRNASHLRDFEKHENVWIGVKRNAELFW